MNDDDAVSDERNRCPTAAELAAWDVGQLGDEASERIVQHLKDCPRCAATVVATARDDDALAWALLRAADESSPDEPELSQALQRLLQTPEPMDADSLPSDALPPASSVAMVPLQIGSYRLLRPLAHGAMGWVYEAEHVNLHRRVALKILPPNLVREPANVERFYREMASVGKLTHPHIVQAFDAGAADGQHYLAMELVDGCDASTLVHRLGPLPIADACELTRQLALALKHAHAHGLVHRDIKPSNAMVAASGQVKLLDLGLAAVRASESAAPELTVAGTAEYMAPEQWASDKAIDARADLYALGCTLFKLCAGVTPFQTSAPSREALAEAHRTANAPSLRVIRPDAPAGLDTLVQRLLAKDPAARPVSADEVARELAPFTNGADLRGAVDRAIPLAEDTVRWPLSQTWKTPPPHAPATRSTSRRRRLVAAITVVCTLGLVGALGVTYFDRGELVLSVEPADAVITIDGQPRSIDDATHSLAVSLPRGKHVIEVRKPGFRAIQHPFNMRRGVREVVHMELAVEEQVIKEIAQWTVHNDGATYVAVSPDGRHVLTTDVHGLVRQWNLDTRALEREFNAHPSTIHCVEYSRDGRYFLTAGDDFTVRIWEADSGEQMHRFDASKAAIWCATFSDDGQRVATAGYDQTVRVWDVTTSECLWTGRAHTTWVRAVDFSPDGRQLVSGGNDAVSIVWDARTGQMRRTLIGQNGVVLTAQFSTDGQRVLTGGYDRQALLWDVEREERMRGYIGHAEGVGAIFTPDEEFVVTYSMDRELRLWRANHPACLARLVGHTGGVTDAACIPGRNEIISTSGDGTARLWRLPDDMQLPQATPMPFATEAPPETPRAEVHRVPLKCAWPASERRLSAIAFLPDGKSLVVAGEDGMARRRSLDTNEIIAEYGPRGDHVLAIAISSDGAFVATGGKDGLVRIWDATSGALRLTYAGHTGWVTGLSFMAGGPWLVSTSLDSTIRSWNIVTQEPLFATQLDTLWKRAIDFSPNLGSSYAVAGGHEAELLLLEIGSGSAAHRFQPRTAHIINDVDYAPNARLAASVGWSGTVEIFDLVAEKHLAALTGHQGVIYGVAFTPDSQHLVTCGEDATVRLWSLDEAAELARLEGPNCTCRALAVSTVTNVIAAVGDDGLIYLWDYDPRSPARMSQSGAGLPP